MSYIELSKQLGVAREVFFGDFSTADQLAGQSHKVVKGYLFDKIVSGGKYQPRIPSGSADEVSNVANSDSLNVLCFDRRQIYQAVNDCRINNSNHAKLAIAGGAAVTNDERRDAVVGLAAAYHRVNEHGLINLVAHTGRCGGVVKYSGIEFYDQLQHGGGWDGEWENEQIGWLVKDLTYHLIERGVSPNIISKFMTHLIGEEYRGMTRIG